MDRLEAAGQGRRSAPSHRTIRAPLSATWAPAGGRSDRPACAAESAVEKRPGPHRKSRPRASLRTSSVTASAPLHARGRRKAKGTRPRPARNSTRRLQVPPTPAGPSAAGGQAKPGAERSEPREPGRAPAQAARACPAPAWLCPQSTLCRLYSPTLVHQQHLSGLRRGPQKERAAESWSPRGGAF